MFKIGIYLEIFILYNKVKLTHTTSGAPDGVRRRPSGPHGSTVQGKRKYLQSVLWSPMVELKSVLNIILPERFVMMIQVGAYLHY